eukprot:4919304-Prymnesium_polylepis.1
MSCRREARRAKWLHNRAAAAARSLLLAVAVRATPLSGVLPRRSARALITTVSCRPVENPMIRSGARLCRPSLLLASGLAQSAWRGGA